MSLTWRIFRSEGASAVRDRLLDRLEGRRRSRSFLSPATGESLPRVRVLNVLPTAPRRDWGGVQTQLLLRLEAEAEQRPWALLFPEGHGYRLEVRDGDVRRAVRIEAPGVAEAVGIATEALTATIVHVEQSVGLPFDEVQDLASGRRRLVLSVHDFGLFCRRPHLVERPHLRFCEFSRDESRCRACLSQSWALSPSATQASWRGRAQDLLSASDAVIYPSDYLRRTYSELFDLDRARQHVVSPPLIPSPVVPPPLRHGTPRHLAYVGSVQPHKGALVLESLIRSLHDAGHRDLRWTVYGGGDPEILRRLRRLPGVRVRGYYRSGSLPSLLRRDGVDLGLLLSIWPETYALTLDECRLAGVPVLAFDHGAPADRIRAWGAGWTVPPEAGDLGMRQAVESLLRNEVGRLEPGQVQIADARTAAESVSKIYRGLAE